MSDGAGKDGLIMKHPDGRSIGGICPDYLTDLNAAWQLVELMRKEGLYFMLIDHAVTGGYLAKFWLNFRVHEATGDTPAVAIALCFAKANSIKQ